MAIVDYRDLVLTFHQVLPRAFELSGLRTGSVRDQMLRATLLVERIEKTRLLDRNRALLIVGAGAAGVAATLRASELGIECLLVEREPWPFGAQCDSTRTIDPTEYDWPQPHWRRGRFRFTHCDQDLPLDFQRAPARDLCDQWERYFAIWINNNSTLANGFGKVEVRLRRDLVALANASDRFECWAEQDDPTSRHKECDIVIGDDAVHLIPTHGTVAAGEFGAIISCIGFGSEIVSVPVAKATDPYTGPRFWQPDFLEDRLFGLPNPQGRLNVLISGGGDGAMQDIQRTLTRKCGRDLFDAIAKFDSSFADKIDLARAAMADDEGRRAHAWKQTQSAPERALRRWHLVFAGIARSVWKRWTDAEQKALCDEVLRETVTVHLYWSMGARAPSFAFGLNRLLTYLVLLMHEKRTGRPFSNSDPKDWAADRPIVISGHRVTRIEPLGHSCQGYQWCHGKLHRVYCSDEFRREHLLGEFEIVIVRHGAPPKPLISHPLVSEQFVPFRFPC